MTTAATRTEPQPTPRRSGGAHHGPPLAAPIGGFVLAWLVGALLVAPLTGPGPTPSPTAHASGVVAFYRDASTATSITAMLFLLAATLLAIAAAVTGSRLAFLAPGAPGPQLAAFGGLAAAGLLAADAATLWALSVPAVRSDADLVVALHGLDFVLGGAAHVAMLGVMVLGLAVTTLFLARTPRWLSLTGLGLAALDLACTITLAVGALTPLVPIGRLLTGGWLVAVAVLVPRTRGARGGAR